LPEYGRKKNADRLCASHLTPNSICEDFHSRRSRKLRQPQPFAPMTACADRRMMTSAIKLDTPKPPLDRGTTSNKRRQQDKRKQGTLSEFIQHVRLSLRCRGGLHVPLHPADGVRTSLVRSCICPQKVQPSCSSMPQARSIGRVLRYPAQRLLVRSFEPLAFPRKKLRASVHIGLQTGSGGGHGAGRSSSAALSDSPS